MDYGHKASLARDARQGTAVNCILCAAQIPESTDTQSVECPRCALLMRVGAKPLDYSISEPQAIPDPNKTYWRLENAKYRFRIIRKFIDRHEVFIDVGCGSGAMLEASKAFFPYHVGFDTNKTLIQHIVTERQLCAIESHFNCALVPGDLKAKKKVFALCHVLEHLERPLDTVAEIYECMRMGDLLYIEAPLHSGDSFKELGYNWSLWSEEHLALYSMQSLEFIAQYFGFEMLHKGTRVFARASKSGKTRAKLFLRSPLKFIAEAARKDSCHTMADVMIADYGCVVLRK